MAMRWAMHAASMGGNKIAKIIAKSAEWKRSISRSLDE
jgi:hypothetical protein